MCITFTFHLCDMPLCLKTDKIILMCRPSLNCVQLNWNNYLRFCYCCYVVCEKYIFFLRVWRVTLIQSYLISFWVLYASVLFWGFFFIFLFLLEFEKTLRAAVFSRLCLDSTGPTCGKDLVFWISSISCNIIGKKKNKQWLL